jgi:transcription initiation factor TFIID subunit 1
VLSTDEGESTASEESDMEELGKNLENMLANKKTSTQMLLEREEQERRELLQKIMEEREGGNSKNSKNKKDEDLQQSNQSPTCK